MKTMGYKGIHSRGFTLIEIIAVISILGLMAAIIAVSMGNRVTESSSRIEAQLFIQAIDFVSEQAVLNGEIIGMFVVEKDVEDSQEKQWCYRWQRFRDNAWVDLPEDTLNEHCMRENIQWEMVIEGRIYAYDPELETQSPVLVWSPSGEATPIEMKFFENGSLTAEGNKPEVHHIEIDMMGGTNWLEREEEYERNESKKH